MILINKIYIGIISNSEIYLLKKKNWNISVLYLPKCSKDESAQNFKEKFDNFAISSNGDYICASTSLKKLLVWRTRSSECIKRETLLKRPAKIVFTEDVEKILIADKSGDVYQLDRNIQSETENLSSNRNSELKPLLGHFSMLLDMEISPDGKYLSTCDRDEKIRISHYPNSYNIHTFCLGHSEFVSQIKYVPNNSKRLLSTSGDGTMKLWNTENGTCLETVDIRSHLEQIFPSKNGMEEQSIDFSAVYTTKMRVLALSDQQFTIALIFSKLPVISFYELNGDSIRHKSFSKTASNPLDFDFLSKNEILLYFEDDVPRVEVVSFPNGDFTPVDEHPILKFWDSYKDKFLENRSEILDGNLLFKCKYDNFADYQRKKEERIKNTINNSLKRRAECAS